MYIKCRGIVIKQSDSGEKGKILTILTENKGVIYAKAAGGKNISAGYFRCCQLFTYSEFHFYSGHNPGVLTILDAVYIRSFFELSKDIELFALASYCAEISKISFIGNSEDTEVLRLLLNTLHTIEKNEHPREHIKSVFEMRLCALLGFEPLLDECDSCGRNLPCEEMLTYFDVSQCSVRCEKCRPLAKTSGPVFHMPAAVYRSMFHAVYSNKDQVFNFKTDTDTLAIFSTISEKYVLQRLEYEPKSLPLYKSFTTPLYERKKDE